MNRKNYIKTQEIMKNFLVILFILSAWFVSHTAKAEPATFKVGLIDETKLLTDFKESKDAQEKVAALRSQLQELSNQLNLEIEKASKDPTLSDVEKNLKLKDAEKKYFTESQKAEKTAGALLDKVEIAVRKAITDEAKAQGLNLVVSKDSTFFGGKEITEQVLLRLSK